MGVHFTFFRMGKILEGLLAGSVEAEVPHGVECLRDAKHIWERLGGVEDQLKHATFNTVLHGIEDLGHIIHDISNELEECKATVGTDLDKLREMSKAFTDPWYFIFHVEHDLIVNGQDVHHEVMDAMAQWENQHFYEYGHSLGLALSKIFLGGQMKNEIPAEALPKNDTATETSSNEVESDYLYGAYHGVGSPAHAYGHYWDNKTEDNPYGIPQGAWEHEYLYPQDNKKEESTDNSEATDKDANLYYVPHHSYSHYPAYGSYPSHYPHYSQDNKEETAANEEDPNWYSRHHTVTTVHHPTHAYGYYDNEQAEEPKANAEDPNYYATHPHQFAPEKTPYEHYTGDHLMRGDPYYYHPTDGPVRHDAPIPFYQQ